MTCWDLTCLVWAILFHIFDIYTDVNVSVHYFKKGEVEFAIATIVIILVPSIVNSCVSYRMYCMDRDLEVSYEWRRKKLLRIVMLVFQLAPMLRYIDSLRYALKSWRAEKNKDKDRQEKYYKLMLKEDADVALLRVFECFLESAPQQVLQVSYILKSIYLKSPLEPGYTGYDPYLSAGSSCLGMALCLMTYQKSIRYVQEDKDNINCKGSVCIFFWHFCVAISRILMLSAMLYISWIWTISSMVTHWMFMTVALSLLESHDFCSSTSAIRFKRVYVCENLANVLFSAVLGLVYIFTYITPGEGGTCFRYTCYYTICLLENVVGAALWSYYQESYWYTVPISFACVVPFVLGCLFMIVYHLKFHPKEYRPPSIMPQRRQVHPSESKHLACTPSPKGRTSQEKVSNGTIIVESGQGEGREMAESEMEEICLNEKL